MARTGSLGDENRSCQAKLYSPMIFQLQTQIWCCCAEPKDYRGRSPIILSRMAAMTKSNIKTPPTQQEVRQARLAAELRANLKKRKALAREKSAGPDDGEAE
jgi:hypothetical protein